MEELVPTGGICEIATRRSTGSRCAMSTTRAITSPWRIRRCRTSMARPTATSPSSNGVSRSIGTYNPHAGRRWSVRNYVKHRAGAGLAAGGHAQALELLRPVPQCGVRRHAGNRAVLPGISAGRRRRRCCAARLPPAATRAAQQRLARYLAYRIDRETVARGHAADDLVERVDEVRGLRRTSTCPISNTACAAITTICARCCRW